VSKIFVGNYWLTPGLDLVGGLTDRQMGGIKTWFKGLPSAVQKGGLFLLLLFCHFQILFGLLDVPRNILTLQNNRLNPTSENTQKNCVQVFLDLINYQKKSEKIEPTIFVGKVRKII
jgi:hypothetical protein